MERGWLEVHAYTVLTTHWHALVRSPAGEMSRALHHIQLGYVRHFNRSRRRDGPLVRGRFRSKLVDAIAYRRLLVGYIDANAPAARLARCPDEYPFCSCRDYVTESGPEWLCREWVHAEVCAVTGIRQFEGRHYATVFRRGFTAEHRRLVERRLQAANDTSEPVDSLLKGASPAVMDWLRRKARLADGTTLGVALVPASHVATTLDQATHPIPADQPRRHRHTDWRRATEALLLRHLSGLTFTEIGAHIDCARPTAHGLVQRARCALLTDPTYAAKVSSLGHRALVATYGA